MFVNYTGSAVNSNGEPVSVAGVGLDMLQLAKMISSYRLGEHGRASLANKDGLVEVRADDALINDLGASDQLHTLLNQHKAQVREITYKGQQLFVGVVWLADLQRYLVVEVPRSDFMLPIEQQLYQSLLIGAGLLLVSLVLLYPLAVSLSRPLQLFQQQLVEITRTLNLSKRLQTEDKAELGELAAQTNTLLERLSFAIRGVQHGSSRLTETANNLALTAGLVNRNTDRQQEEPQSMAAAVEEMSSSVAEVTSTMEELSASSTQIADHSQSVVDVASLTLDSSKKGAAAMQHLQLRMADTHHDSENSLQEIVQLGRKSKEISKVMDLINTLADPIIHLLRNALDHGIETPDIRQQKCKPVQGLLQISARQDGGWVVLEVRDDGQGLSLVTIRDKALKKGLVSSEQLAEMSDQQVSDLIFEPGFSTSNIITEFSGRGVGMDVVKRSIVDDLQGVISLHSSLDQGTCFTLRLPLSLAMMRVLLIRAGEQVLGFTAQYVTELISVAVSGLINVADRNAVIIRNEFVPVIVALARLLKHRLRNTDVIGRYGGEEFALLLKDISSDTAEALVNELREDFSNIIFNAGQQQFSCTFSAGISMYPDYKRAEDLRMAADVALYQAKTQGRNQVVVSKACNE